MLPVSDDESCALRTMDADVMIKLGFSISDLHCHITQLHQEQFGDHSSTQHLTLYRGQGMEKKDFEKMTSSKGGLLSFNCFLSTSKNHQISLVFAERALANPQLVGVLFVMTIDPSEFKTPIRFCSRGGSTGSTGRRNTLLHAHHLSHRSNHNHQ